MSYEKNTWANGDVITAAKLNNIEEGVASASGHDAEVIFYHDNNTSSNWENTIVSGDFQTIAAMVSDDIAPDILVKYTDLLSGHKFSSSTIVIYYYYTSYSLPFIRFQYFDPFANDRVFFDWYSDDTVELA